MFDSLETVSILALYSAMIIYALAFIFYTIDLSGRASSPGQQSGQVTRWARVGYSLTILAWLLHTTATVMRGIGAHRVPWANMYEFALTATAVTVAVYLVAQFFLEIRYLGTLITGLALLFLGITKVGYYVPIAPLQPALDSYWLLIHIIVAMLAVGFLTLSFGFSVLQLLQTHRIKQQNSGKTPALKFLAGIPDAISLENFSYRVAIIGFVFWSFTLVAGAIWAERAWSRYWGWDVKEVWTFVIWVLYAGFIHARATRGWRGTRSAWLSVISYSAVIFNFSIVNVYFKGLHAYSGL
ncbi:c-type cytochrome biogenesis protein CcsB [Canibacter zhuwentaonis]|uniref:c-type cytochrome biogenesis protein CcsB n=1 Tax=Canibacter zhuwentaonis TaxID=2837491 RepID=UPI0035104544